MATTIYYVFSAPGTEKLASLVSITQDLHGVLDLCQKFDDIKGKPFDETLWEALSTGIVVRYARCFSTGIRTSLPHSLMETASSEHRDLHRRFMAMRNMHVAHSVNELEETYVTVSVEYELNRPPEIKGVSFSHGRFTGLEAGDPKRMKALAQWLLCEVDKQIQAEREAVLVLAKQAGVDAVEQGGFPELGNSAYEKAIYKRRSRP